MFEIFIYSLFIFIAAVILHIILTKIIGEKKYVANAYTLLFCLCIVSFSLALFLFHLSIFDSVLMLFYLVIFWNSYLVFTINTMNSISFRIIVEIGNSSGKSLSEDDINRIYDDRAMLDSRLADLKTNGFIGIRNDDSIFLTYKGERFARLLGFIRKLFGINFYGYA